MISPFSSTMIASALRTVESLCAMTKHRSALHEAIHPLLNERLGAGINRASGLVEDQHRRICTGRTGDGQAAASGPAKD